LKEHGKTKRQDVFTGIPVSNDVRRGIAACGFVEPTEVQATCIEPSLAGRDLVVQSRTGTGKTAAFGIPLVEMTTPGNGVQALVITPTRELALQVSLELSKLGGPKGVKVLAVYGGVGYGRQLDGLREENPIIVGTPGRILDHIDRGTLVLSKLKVLVLDEADEMLSRGFLPDIIAILSRCPDRQTLLFSATIPEEIERIAKRYMHRPLRIELSGDQVAVQSIENKLYIVDPGESRPRQLLSLLEAERPKSAIIFCNTRADTELVTNYLVRRGYNAALLNSDLVQSRRENVMNMVKKGALKYLVATDIAARGIDISDLSHVIHYSLPKDAHVYIHRSGRTGRIGKVGVAVSLFSEQDLRDVFTRRKLESNFKLRFEQRPAPGRRETLEMLADRRLKELRRLSEAMLTEEHLAVAKAILGDGDAERLVASLLQELDEWEYKKTAAVAGNKVREKEKQAASGRAGRAKRRKRSGKR